MQPWRRQPQAGGERASHNLCVSNRGAVRQVIRPSTALPLKSTNRVLADCSLFGITDVSRVGKRQQEAPERRICALAGVGECNHRLFLAGVSQQQSILLISLPPAHRAMSQAEQEAAVAWITWSDSAP